MNPMDLELSTRLERLERENRRMKRFGLAAVLGAGLLGMVGAAAPAVCDVLTGERLVLRDESGRSRVTLDAYRTDNPAITLADKQGRARAKLALDGQGDLVVNLLDEKGATRGTHRFGADVAPSTPSGNREVQPAKKTDEATMSED